MKINVERFRVKENEKVALKDWKTQVKPCYKSKANYKKTLAKRVDEIRDLQQLHYASKRYSLLLIFQGMDAAGKDGAIKNVMSGINPQGCEVSSFKQPSAEELEHDFLWRTSRKLPARGKIGIFNRSYYEEVLVVKVHPGILFQENVPEKSFDDKNIWQGRYRSITQYEEHLHRNGTQVIKFFLHLSKEEQRQRLLARINDPNKNWKFSSADMEERKMWKQYVNAYESCLSETSSKHSPWYVVPADDKENAQLIISQVIINTLQSFKLSYPQVTKERQKELQVIRQQLLK